MKHASVKFDGMEIPLIGIDPTETLEECDLCHDHFHLQSIWFTGRQILCEKCMAFKEIQVAEKTPQFAFTIQMSEAAKMVFPPGKA